ncbi:MAG: hypothetical protein Q4C14_03175, partial [Bacillota bacterium]|nr:hypothetical protein [Bacillota bacterium]
MKRYIHIKRRFLNNRRGYIVAEAAILMPVFLFSAVILIYIIKIIHFQEIIHFEGAENLIEISSGYRIGGGSFGERMYESRVYHDVQARTDKEININAELVESEDIYTADINYSIDLSLPFGLYDDIVIRDVLAYRRWSGTENEG